MLNDELISKLRDLREQTNSTSIQGIKDFKIKSISKPSRYSDKRKVDIKSPGTEY